jgi:hypothetical protein
MLTKRILPVKVKGQLTLQQATKTQRGSRSCRVSRTLSLTSALDGVGGQHYAPEALAPGKTRYPL